MYGKVGTVVKGLPQRLRFSSVQGPWMDLFLQR
jgi:hypothetical protein